MVSLQLGFKVRPESRSHGVGQEKKKKILLKKKKNVVKETALTVPLRAANKAQRKVSPQQSCVQRGVGSTNVIETAGIQCELQSLVLITVWTPSQPAVVRLCTFVNEPVLLSFLVKLARNFK